MNGWRWWLRWDVQGAPRNSSFLTWLWKICFNGNSFWQPGFVSAAVIEMNHLPHALSEIIHEFISSDYFSPSQCDLKVSSWLVTNCIHSLIFGYLGALGKLCPFLSNCMTVLVMFPSTSTQKCVSGVVDKLPNCLEYWGLVFVLWFIISYPLWATHRTFYINFKFK